MIPMAFRARPPLEENFRLLLFFGSPRTGSTMLGQILNMHPQALVANEHRFLQKIVREGNAVEKEITRLRKTAFRHFYKGIENDQHFKSTLAHFQSKWTPFSYWRTDPTFTKKSIHYLGDKKAGGNINIYIEEPKKTKIFLNRYRPVMLQIVRHPIDAAHSAKAAFGVDFEQALEDQVKRTLAAARLLQEHPDQAITVFYEELLEEPASTLRNILGRLNLDATESWIQKILGTISPLSCKERPESEVFLANKIIKKHGATEIFSTSERVVASK